MNKMAYIAFDLDETIGRFSVLDGYLHFANPPILYKNMLQGQEPFTPSADLQVKINSFFSTFAECLLAKEPGLGLLRPGIFEIMKRISDAKDRGLVERVAIYSNNGNMNCLLLASKMIENHLGKPGFFCDHVNWYDPRRRYEIQLGKPGAATKSVSVLKTVFQDSKCSKPGTSIANKNIYFFDDTIHQNILTGIGQSNYFKVEPFKHDASIEEVEACFVDTNEKIHLLEDEEYKRYVVPILRALGVSQEASLGLILAALAKYNNRYQDDLKSILERLDKLFPLKYNNDMFPVVDGGKRKRKTRKHRKNN